MIDTNRESLLKIVNLVRPALSTLDFIPALKHILFADGFATAYDDKSAIRVALPDKALSLGLCLPGELLIRALGSFNAEKVALQEDKNGSVRVSSGRSQLKLPTLEADKFPFKTPSNPNAPFFAVGSEIIAGINKTLVSAGNDPTRPATMGVTLDIDEAGYAVLFATDNVTISRYQTAQKIKLPGDSPIILPTFFCEQLLALHRHYYKPGAVDCDIEIHDGALVAQFTDDDGRLASLTTKTLVDTMPLDFPKIVSKYCDPGKLSKRLTEIPAAFDAAIGRALLVLGNSTDKHMKVSPTGEHLKLFATSDAGESSDSISYDGEGPSDFSVDPALVARGLKGCSHMVLLQGVLVLADQKAQFVHLIAHMSA